MKKNIFIIIALFAAGTAAAQDDISKQMEVTKAYTPKVGRAAKLSIEPRMTDTVRLRPEIGYSISPSAWQTVFETPKFRPAAISVAPYVKTRPFYLRAGVGYPLQSTADLYINPYMGNRSTLGLFFNHRGSYSKIMNELGAKPNSTEMLNGAGLYGSKFYSRYKLEGDVAYDHRVYHAYGVQEQGLFGPPPPATSFIPLEAYKFGKAVGRIVFGDTFEDLSRFNFQVGTSLGAAHGFMPNPIYAYHDLLPQVSGFYQLDIDAWARTAKMFNPRHGFEIGLYERGVAGLGELSDYGSLTLMFRPRYLLSLEKLSLSAGIDINYVKNNAFWQNYASIAPQFDLRLKIARGYFSPYLKLASHLDDGSFESLTRTVPFVRTAAATGWTHDLRFGFSGSAGGVFSYHVYGGASKLEDHAVFIGYQVIRPAIYIFYHYVSNTVYNPLWFATMRDDGMRYVVGAELGLTNLGGFSAKFAANRYWENMDNLPLGNLPAWDANIELGYSYKDKFTITAGTKVLGDRDNYTVTPNIYTTTFNSLPPVADVFAGVEVKLFDGFDVFVEGRNLANQKLWPWNYYRGVGANVMAGVKIVF